MFTQTLLPDTLRGLKDLNKISFINQCYLAGGTALALQIGHRISVDLDFFTKTDFNEVEISAELAKLDRFKLERTPYKTILGWIGETRFSLFYYPYPVIDKLIPYEGVNLLGIKDLSAMKIHALEDRGTKRDFVDIFFLTKHFSLDQMLEFYDQKYNCLNDHLFNIVKSLNYFEDAENDKMPRMVTEVSWDKIKQYFEKEVIKLSKDKLGLHTR